MAASDTDWKLNAASTGFTLGFGILTAWTAIQQTVSIKAPLKNAYLYLIWGEHISCIGITVIGLTSTDMMSKTRKTPGYDDSRRLTEGATSELGSVY